MSLSHASSAGIIGQSMVSALSTAIVAIGERRDLKRTGHAANARAVDLGGGNYKIGWHDQPAGETGVFGLGPPHRPLGAAEESAALQTKSGGKHKQDRPNATRHCGKLRLLV
jgi:hypothetical protein